MGPTPGASLPGDGHLALQAAVFAHASLCSWWAQLAASPYSEFGAFSKMVGLALGNTIRRGKGALAWGVEYWRHTTWSRSAWASFRTRTDRELPGALSKPLILRWVEIRKIFISWVSCQFQRGRALKCKEGNHLWELFTVGSASWGLLKSSDLCLTVICNSEGDHEKYLNCFQSSPSSVPLCYVRELMFLSSYPSFAKPEITWWETGMLLRCSLVRLADVKTSPFKVWWIAHILWFLGWS